jgi:hypothetical protein
VNPDRGRAHNCAAGSRGGHCRLRPDRAASKEPDLPGRVICNMVFGSRPEGHGLPTATIAAQISSTLRRSPRPPKHPTPRTSYLDVDTASSRSPSNSACHRSLGSIGF